MSVAGDRAARFALAALAHDPGSDLLLEQLVRGLLDPADHLSQVAHNGDYPWQQLTDPGTAPLWALPYAGQWTGGRMPPRLAGETDSAYEARAQVELSRPRTMRRGSPQSLKALAQAYLTGTRTAVFAQRIGGSLFDHAVYVLAAECADQAALAAVLNQPDVIPAGHKITVNTLPPGSWTVGMLEDVFFGMPVTDLETAFTTVARLETNTR